MKTIRFPALLKREVEQNDRKEKICKRGGHKKWIPITG